MKTFLKVTLLTVVATAALALYAGKPVGIWSGNSAPRLEELLRATIFTPQWTSEKPLTVKFTGKEYNNLSSVVYIHGSNNIFRFREWKDADIAAMEKFVRDGGQLLILVDGATPPPDVSRTKKFSALLGAAKWSKLEGNAEIIDPQWAECGKIPEVFKGMITPGFAALTGFTTGKAVIGNASGAIVVENRLGKGRVLFANISFTRGFTGYRQPHGQMHNTGLEQFMPFAKKLHAMIMGYSPALAPQKREIWDYQPLGPKTSPVNYGSGEYKKLVSAKKIAKLSGTPVTLVSDGKPQALLIARRSGERGALLELQRIVKLMTGAELPLASEKAVREKDGFWMWRGKSWKTRIIIEKTSNIQINAQHNTISIGAQEASIGVHSFMHEFLGYRMLWPGKDGEVYQECKNLSVEPLKLTDNPPVKERNIRNGLSCGKYKWVSPDGKEMKINMRPRMQKNCELGGFDPREVISAHKGHHSWWAAQRLGGTIYKRGGANFYNWKKKYSSKPEYFALQFNGTRDMKTNHIRICKSNPDVVNAAALDALTALKLPKNKDVKIYSLSPSDGSYDTFCMCPECRKYDPLDGDRITSRVFLGRNRPVFQYVRLTDRVLRFTCEVSKQIRAERPDVRVAYLAYSSYLCPPQYFRDVPKELFVTFVGLEYLDKEQLKRDRKYWDYWSSTVDELCWRPNFLGRGNGLPFVYTREMDYDMKRCVASGMVAGDYDTLPHHWATQGLNYYVLAQLLWDPAQPVEDIIRDYCEKGFGAGADDMRKYYAHCEKLTDKYAELRGESTKHAEDLTNAEEKFQQKFLRVFTESEFAVLQKFIDDARSKVAENSAEKRRIDFVASGLKFTAELSAFWRKYYSGVAKTSDVETLVQSWYQQFEKYPFAVNIPGIAGGNYYSFFRHLKWQPAKLQK